jgi:hypothetical protein
VLFALASRPTLLNRFIPIVEIPPKIQDRISFQQAKLILSSIDIDGGKS